MADVLLKPKEKPDATDRNSRTWGADAGPSRIDPATFAQAAAEAAQSEATFYVANMTCALCPVTVRRAMSGVAGVQSVEVNFDARTAHVVFDPALTDAEAIARASAQAGYPAEVQG